MTKTFSEEYISHLQVRWWQSRCFKSRCSAQKGERCPGEQLITILSDLLCSGPPILLDSTNLDTIQPYLDKQRLCQSVGFNWFNVFSIGLHNHLCPLDWFDGLQWPETTANKYTKWFRKDNGNQSQLFVSPVLYTADFLTWSELC